MSEKIIKPGGSPLGAARVVKAGTYDATLDASRIVEAAHEQAQQILEQAEQQRRAIREAAQAEGYERGLRQWNAAIAEANVAEDRFLAESEPALIQMAVKIAEKIIGEELRTSRDVIVTITRECLNRLRRERSLTIRVSPGDVELVRSRIDVLRDAVGPQRSLEVVADPAIRPGGCIVETEYGIIDARLETQLRCMEEILLRAARK